MHITKHNTLYKVQGTKKTYDVNLENKSCTCPNFQFRLIKIHQYCKHIQAVIDKEEKRDTTTYKNIKQYLKKHPKTSLEQLEKLFNPEAIDDLISRQEINPLTEPSTTQ